MHTQQLFIFCAFFLPATLRLKASTTAFTLLTQLFEQTKFFPDHDTLKAQIEKIYATQNTALLDSALSLLINYAGNFCALEQQKIACKLQLQLSQELLTQGQDFLRVTTAAQAMLEQQIDNLRFNTQFTKHCTNLKNLGLQTLAAGATIIGNYSHLIAPEGFYLPTLLDTGITAKICMTGLWGATFLALVLKIEYKKYQDRKQQRQHLHQMIFALSELRWQMNRLFMIHERTLQSFMTELEDLESLWPNINQILTAIQPSTEIVGSLKLILAIHHNTFCKINDAIKTEKLTFMTMSKVMRALRKNSTNPQELMRLFSDINTLASIDPLGVQNLLENHERLAQYFNNSHFAAVKSLEFFSKNGPLPHETLKLDWMGYAKMIGNIYQLFFAQRKSDYYLSTIDETIEDAQATLNKL